ncbi:hypothetical protein LCGC14_2586620, partial [marine sediment metagenome]
EYNDVQMNYEGGYPTSRLKLIWLLERLQEEVL